MEDDVRSERTGPCGPGIGRIAGTILSGLGVLFVALAGPGARAAAPPDDVLREECHAAAQRLIPRLYDEGLRAAADDAARQQVEQEHAEFEKLSASIPTARVYRSPLTGNFHLDQMRAEDRVIEVFDRKYRLVCTITAGAAGRIEAASPRGLLGSEPLR
jgi:hypothetical protein